jgi:bacterioferritin-associated ferredoxin
MQPDPEEVCICFHVPLSKLEKFCRLHKPVVASQLSQCYGAGTGCGWCVPYLEKIHEQVKRGEKPSLGMSAEEYQARRQTFHATGERPEDSE